MLTKEFEAIVERYAEPLPPVARGHFRAAVERKLECWREPTPELVGGICVETQRAFIIPREGWPSGDGRVPVD